MMLVWTTIATVLMVISSAATFLTMLHLRFRWDVHKSSVRYLFWLFFLFIWSWCTLRSVFFVWLVRHDARSLVDPSDTSHRWTFEEIDRLGVHGIMFLAEAREPWFVALTGVGDVALLGITLTMYPLVYELGRLARMSMDRGVEKEQKQTRWYCIIIAVGLSAYAVVYTVVAVQYKGYGKPTHRLLLGIYGIQFLALAYMVFQLVRLKANGRKFETVQGTFVSSPIYQRLKLIMFVYAFFAFQFQLSMMIISLHDIEPDGSIAQATGVSLLIYNASGLALSVTTSCSQACVFSTCAPCLPEDFEAQFLHQRFVVTPDADLEPPRGNPVFVYTDIESSSALWNSNGEMMGLATEIHDNILRSTLIKHRGYEVTTVGDAFQIAFHTVRDAIEYCLDVQLMLLVAKWPKDIHDAVPATAKERSGRRTIFNGLRVRMGIHDANEIDGTLVQDVHAVTGKATYTGVSEVVAEYVGDLGSGGQILMTERVATWLKHNREDLSVDVFLEYMGEHTVPQVNSVVTLYQVLPAMLADRRKHFAPLRVEYMATQRQMRLSRRADCRFLWSTPVLSASSVDANSVVTVSSPMESVRSASGVNDGDVELQVPHGRRVKSVDWVVS